MSTIPISLSGPSVLQIAAERGGVDLAAPEPAAPKADPKAILRRCHAVGCGAPTEHGCLFCKPHWTSLPPSTRRRLLFFVTRGQWDDASKCRPEWLREAREALEIILQRELRTLTARVFANLPAGYDPAALKVARFGVQALIIRQAGQPDLVASLASGEVRVVPPPEPPANDDPGDAQPG